MYLQTDDMRESIRMYELLEQDVLNLFEYIEPTLGSLEVYSLRIYELFLRICTEVESNFKLVLKANGYQNGISLNMTDYKKLNCAMGLDKYALGVNVGRLSDKFELKPFEQWSIPTGGLPWYQDYNAVKHNRYDDFEKASLKNLLLALSGLYVILYAQFGDKMIERRQRIKIVFCEEPFEQMVPVSDSPIFNFKTVAIWTDAELYDFNGNFSVRDISKFDKIQF